MSPQHQKLAGCAAALLIPELVCLFMAGFSTLGILAILAASAALLALIFRARNGSPR